MKKSLYLSCIVLLTCSARPIDRQITVEKKWENLVTNFSREYNKLDITGLTLSYVTNISNIKDAENLSKQAQLFAELRSDLNHVKRQDLPPTQQLEYDLLMYQLLRHEERLALEQQWISQGPDSISTYGLATIPNGRIWYRYFLKQWIDQTVTPESMYEFGLSEIDRVKASMKALQEHSGMDSLDFQQYISDDSFFYTDVKTVQAEFDKVKAELGPKLDQFFPGISTIPDHTIERGGNEAMAQVPAFYTNNTFYYNFFGQSFNKRQIVWIYLHEAVPGHHYERNYSRSVRQTELQNLFNVPCYAEGWAAYVEEIGNEIGAYRDIYDELGKWEWDIIRSVRVPLDVALNYYGWSDEKALDFWRQHITGKDDIGRREIARMKRWPCQVITYKYGGRKIMEWKAHFEKQGDFDLKKFHETVLGRGPIPISILEKLVIQS